MVTHQLQVERRTGKVRQSETDVLPLCYATNLLCVTCGIFCQVRNQLAIQVTNLQVDVDQVTAQLDEEAAEAENVRAQLQRASADLAQLRSKYDKELAAAAEQFDDTR